MTSAPLLHEPAEAETRRQCRLDQQLDELVRRSGQLSPGTLIFRLFRNGTAEQITNAFHCDFATARRTASRLVLDGPMAPQAERDHWHRCFQDALDELSSR